MPAMTDATYNKVRLIPWDPTNETQFQRMYDQRVACGWATGAISPWKDKVLKGDLNLYWIVLTQELPGAEKLLADHIAKYTNESEPLIDTATAHNGATREPSKATFIPVGHIGLGRQPVRDEKFTLPSSTLWVSPLYISWAIQAGGLGRSAMGQVEAIAASPPLNSTTIALDALQEEFQRDHWVMRGFYANRRGDAAGPIRTNVDWYQRQGYEIFTEIQYGEDFKDPVSGEVVRIPLLFMKKSLG